MRRGRAAREKGAALVIVLVLAAILSFVALAVAESMALAAQRAINTRARAEAMWRAFGAEALAESALTAAARERPGVMTLDDPWVERPFEAPMEGGTATLRFSDATRCVNVNSLVADAGDGLYTPREAGARELVAVLEAAGASAADAQTVADLVTDWIDADGLAEPRGAEDSYYTARPTPYRTGGALMADRSELRALAEIDRQFYRNLSPFVCARPGTEPSAINVNMLRPQDAPVLIGLVGRALSPAAALDVIAARPPGGYGSIEAFWAHPAFAGLQIPADAAKRTRLTSRYVEARAKIVYDGAIVNATLVFEVDDAGAARLISRRWGSEL